MSVLRKWPIARLVPVVAVVLFAASVLAAVLAVAQRNSTSAAEKDLQAHIEAQVKVDRFSLLSATAAMFNAQATAYPQSAVQSKQAEQAATKEMGEVLRWFETADLDADEKLARIVLEAGAHFVGRSDRREHLLFEGRGPAIPEKRSAVTSIQDRWNAARRQMSRDASGDTTPIGEGAGGLVARRARERAIG